MKQRFLTSPVAACVLALSAWVSATSVHAQEADTVQSAAQACMRAWGSQHPFTDTPPLRAFCARSRRACRAGSGGGDVFHAVRDESGLDLNGVIGVHRRAGHVRQATSGRYRDAWPGPADCDGPR